MARRTWVNSAHCEFVHEWLSPYVTATQATDCSELRRFWKALIDDWFETFPMLPKLVNQGVISIKGRGLNYALSNAGSQVLRVAIHERTEVSLPPWN